MWPASKQANNDHSTNECKFRRRHRTMKNYTDYFLIDSNVFWQMCICACSWISMYKELSVCCHALNCMHARGWCWCTLVCDLKGDPNVDKCGRVNRVWEFLRNLAEAISFVWRFVSVGSRRLQIISKFFAKSFYKFVHMPVRNEH